jgi:hypothetical protein
MASDKRHPILLGAATAIGGAAVAYGGYALNTWLRYGRPLVDGPSRNPFADKFLPEFEVRERHEVTVLAPAEITYDLAYHLDLESSPIVRAIFAARALLFRSTAAERTPSSEFLQQAVALGWSILDEQPGSKLILGAVTKPWEANVEFIGVPAAEFAKFNDPGFAKIVWTLEVDALSPDTSVFRTETRVATTDAESRRKFRRYWSFTSPGILLIRREALRIVKKGAEQLAAIHKERTANV